QGHIVHLNRACDRALGHTNSEAKGRPFLDLLTPGEAEPIAEQFRQLLADGQPFQREGHWLAKNGELRLITWSAAAVPGVAGPAEFILLTGLDVTEQRRLQLALLAARQEMRLARAIQQRLFPQALRLPGFDIGGVSHPAEA